jgi:hypothetical protein
MEAPTIATESPPTTTPPLMKRRKRDSELRVVAETMPDGTLRWKIAGLYINGKRKREFFTSEEAAKHRLQSLNIQRENLGTRLPRMRCARLNRWLPSL